MNKEKSKTIFIAFGVFTLVWFMTPVLGFFSPSALSIIVDCFMVNLQLLNIIVYALFFLSLLLVVLKKIRPYWLLIWVFFGVLFAVSQHIIDSVTVDVVEEPVVTAEHDNVGVKNE